MGSLPSISRERRDDNYQETMNQQWWLEHDHLTECEQMESTEGGDNVQDQRRFDFFRETGKVDIIPSLFNIFHTNKRGSMLFKANRRDGGEYAGLTAEFFIVY